MEPDMTELAPEKQAERLARQRWWILVLYIASWFVWQLFSLKPVSALPFLHGIPAIAIALGGFVVWSIALIMLLRFMSRTRRNRLLNGMLNDELTRDHSRRAFIHGYWALLFALVVASPAAAFGMIPDALTLVQGLIMVGVSVPLVSFIWLDR
jgi:hypothetical protein